MKKSGGGSRKLVRFRFAFPLPSTLFRAPMRRRAEICREVSFQATGVARIEFCHCGVEVLRELPDLGQYYYP